MVLRAPAEEPRRRHHRQRPAGHILESDRTSVGGLRQDLAAMLAEGADLQLVVERGRLFTRSSVSITFFSMPAGSASPTFTDCPWRYRVPTPPFIVNVFTRCTRSAPPMASIAFRPS